MECSLIRFVGGTAPVADVDGSKRCLSLSDYCDGAAALEIRDAGASHDPKGTVLPGRRSRKETPVNQVSPKAVLRVGVRRAQPTLQQGTRQYR
ncbi:hypothetical protein NDU88_007358 [Pleurodeles waltl]|uniref:Uncharacterized protein n=1 Tax=Pleurodeles waltl TaxID=8319 RepID=A0AAV7TZI4_PLEWA|nr:hypothetical protein NDU88_007358 [Pleurodeles waltl]